MRLFGIVKEIAVDYVLLVTKDGTEYKFYIEDPWTQFIRFIHPLDELFIQIKDNHDIIDDRALLVIEPRYLVSVTETLKAISCPRQVYVNHMGANSKLDPILQQKTLKGNLLHDVFTHKIIHDSEVKEAINQTLDKNTVNLLLADFDERTAREYLNTDAILFKRFSISGQSELDVRHYGYGLAGKLDALSDSNMIIELKSSNIPDVHPYPDHNIQMGIYQELLEDYLEKKPKGKILYVSNGRTALKDPTPWAHQKTIIARNYTYLVMSGKYIPPLLRGEDMKTCRSCYRKEGCYQLCAGMEHQRDCQDCYLEPSCDQSSWSNEKQIFYEKQTKSLVLEESEVKKQEYFGHRASFSDDQEFTKIIATKSKEYIDPYGNFVTNFGYVDSENRFRKGDFVTIYPIVSNDVVEVSYQGIIVNIEADMITINSYNSLPDEIEIFPSSTSALLRRNRDTIFKSVNSQSKLMNMLIDYIDGELFELLDKRLKDIEFNDKTLIKPLMDYNANQVKSIKLALSTPDFLTIQGPAGTGKTSVIIEIINQLIQRGKSVLVSAFTNMAVDNVALKLDQHNLPFLRFGNTTDNTVQNYMIDNLVDEFKEFTKDRSGKVILSTTTTIGKNSFDDLFFDYVLIDEASQMTVPHSLMPILHGEKAILVGDHKQLPPIVLSEEASELGLSVSLFEQLVPIKSRFIMLTDQYRMSDDILDLPNRLFYNEKLVSASEKIGNQKLEFSNDLISPDSFQLIAIEKNNEINYNQSNSDELLVILKIIHDLIKDSNVTRDEIGIISPYRAQVALLRKYLPKFNIDTIDRFQGTEARVIIFSTTTVLNVPLLADERRINVALTRAKEKLIIIQTTPSKMKQNSLMRSVYRDAFRRGKLTELREKSFNLLEDGIKSIIKELQITSQLPVKGESVVFYQDKLLIFYNSIPLLNINLEEDEVCVICYQKTNTGVQCPGCGYLYHMDQLIQWVRKSHSCPVCKHRLTLLYL